MSPKPNPHEKKHETVVRRSSRKHDDESHGGAWKVAFADFSLALMCLFLVLWVMAARTQERARHNFHQIGFAPVSPEEPSTLEHLMLDYVDHLKSHLRQIFESSKQQAVRP